MTAALLAPHAALLTACTVLAVLVVREGHRGRVRPGHGRTRAHSRWVGTEQHDRDDIEGDQQ